MRYKKKWLLYLVEALEVGDGVRAIDEGHCDVVVRWWSVKGEWMDDGARSFSPLLPPVRSVSDC